MTVKLIRMRVVDGVTKTDATIGECTELPAKGKRFELIAEAMDPKIKAAGGVRFIRTTPVVSSERDGDHIIFKTQTYEYILEVMENEKQNH